MSPGILWGASLLLCKDISGSSLEASFIHAEHDALQEGPQCLSTTALQDCLNVHRHLSYMAGRLSNEALRNKKYLDHV